MKKLIFTSFLIFASSIFAQSDIISIEISLILFSESNNYGISTSEVVNEENINADFTLSVGADYFITDYFAIEGSVNYSFLNYEFT